MASVSEINWIQAHWPSCLRTPRCIFIYIHKLPRISRVDQMVKNLPAMQESWVQSLGWDDPLEKGMATYGSILAWRIPWTKEPGGLLTMGCRVRCNWATITFTDYPYVFINTYLYLDLSQPLKADPASSPHLQFVSIRGLQTRIYICLFVVCVSAGQELRIIFAFLKGCLKKPHTHKHT